MRESVLATIAIAQAFFLGLLLVLLLTRHFLGGMKVRFSRQAADLATAAVSRWLAREVGEEHLRQALDRLSFTDLSRFLQTLSVQLGGDDWERLSDAARRTSWFGRVRAHSRSRVWWRRLQAARAYMVLARPEDLAAIEALLRDPNTAVRRAAVWSLKRVGSPELTRALLDLAGSETKVLRAQMLEILAGSREHVLGPLVERLREGSGREELRTALSLSEILGVPSLLEHVLPHADSSDFEVRIAVARALAAYPHARTSRTLARLLDDEAWQVRAQAAAGLGAIGAREAVRDLDSALTDTSWWVRLRSALALRRLGAVGVEALEARRPEPDPYAYEMARYVLSLDGAAVAEYSGPYVVDYSETAALPDVAATPDQAA